MEMHNGRFTTWHSLTAMFSCQCNEPIGHLASFLCPASHQELSAFDVLLNELLVRKLHARSTATCVLERREQE